MTQVKKAYQEIVNFLEANKDVKVSKILAQVIEMTEAKAGGAGQGSTFIKDKQGNTVAILDYYFKKWMPLVGDNAVEFGAKVKTATGFNSMCKAGVSLWTKQQREAKNANAILLSKVASGEIKPSDIIAEQAKIEEERKVIVETEMGFFSKEDVIAYLVSMGIDLAD